MSLSILVARKEKVLRMNQNAIRNGKWVRLRYAQKLILQDGRELCQGPNDVSFVFGIERQLPSIENALEGRRTGDRLLVDIPEEELFGAYDPDLVREIPKGGLKKARLKEGSVYREIKQGTLVTFVVKNLYENSLLADFNHPQAGARARGEIDILEVRDADEDDIRGAHDRMGCG